MNSEAPLVVTLGETLALFAQSDVGVLRSGTAFEFRVGGAESNVAVGLARLGIAACWIGRLGQDSFGDEVVRALRGEGVQVRAVRDRSRPTGLMVRDRRTSIHQRVTYYRSGSAGSALDEVDLGTEVIAGARILHVTGITMALSLSAAAAVRHAVRVARAHGVLVSLDVNFRSRLWSPDSAREALRSLLPEVDLLFAGTDEASLILSDPETDADPETLADPETGAEADALSAARRLQRLGPSEVVVKRGELGAVARSGREEAVGLAASVPVVDTVGAGDAFVAGYLAAVLDGADLPGRLDLACSTGAFACTSAGDWEGAASRVDLALLRSVDPVAR